MNSDNPFKWRHYEAEIILFCVQWYLRYPLNYRNLEEMMQERSLDVEHTTIYRWVQRHSPEMEKICRRYLKPTNDSYRVDETYIKIKGKWKYLYRAVDSRGNTIDFMLSSQRNKYTAKRFFKKAFKASNCSKPRVVNVDKNPAYSPAMDELKNEGILSEDCKLRQNKYLNNIVEQDHRFIKGVVNPGLGFSSFNTARRTLKGYKAMHMIRKGQIEEVGKGEIVKQVKFIEELFGIDA